MTVTAELLPRPSPFVDGHAALRWSQREGGDIGIGVARLKATVMEGEEVTDPQRLLWVGGLRRGFRYFTERVAHPHFAVVVREETWAVVSVLTREEGLRRHRQQPHVRRLAGRLAAAWGAKLAV